jgi:hypothetical protein
VVALGAGVSGIALGAGVSGIVMRGGVARDDVTVRGNVVVCGTGVAGGCVPGWRENHQTAPALIPASRMSRIRMREIPRPYRGRLWP